MGTVDIQGVQVGATHTHTLSLFTRGTTQVFTSVGQLKMTNRPTGLERDGSVA